MLKSICINGSNDREKVGIGLDGIGDVGIMIVTHRDTRDSGSAFSVGR